MKKPDKSAVRTGLGIADAFGADWHARQQALHWAAALACVALGVLGAVAAPEIWDRITTIIAELIV